MCTVRLLQDNHLLLGNRHLHTRFFRLFLMFLFSWFTFTPSLNPIIYSSYFFQFFGNSVDTFSFFLFNFHSSLRPHDAASRQDIYRNCILAEGNPFTYYITRSVFSFLSTFHRKNAFGCPPPTPMFISSLWLFLQNAPIFCIR